MTKSELIEKLQEKHTSILNDYNYRYRGGNNDVAASECRSRMKDVLEFIDDLKNLNGETVKRQELIDFLNYHLENNLDGTEPNWIGITVDDYLKSINE